jgi:uncharacterized protein
MADINRMFRLDGLPPLLRLIFSFCIIVVIGKLMFYIFLLAGTLIFGVGLSDIGKSAADVNPGNGKILRYVQVAQETGVFLLPSLLLAWLLGGGKNSYLRIGRMPGLTMVILVILAAILAIPIIEYTGILNSRMVLPESLSGLQSHLRGLEDKAAKITGILIASSGPEVFALNLFILAVLPALCEEFLFRGILQQLLGDLFRSKHAAVWVTAVIFSAVHLQFYGFIPRLLLGLLFGYLFVWSGNLWFPVLAHFINNALPVTYSYISELNAATGGLEKGKESLSFPFPAVILSVLVLVFFYKESMKSALSPAASSPPERTPGD